MTSNARITHEVDVPTAPGSGMSERVLLAKWTTQNMTSYIERSVSGYALPKRLAPHAARISVLQTVSTHPTSIRPGWNPNAPWSEPTARERGRRYWSISEKKVARWLSSPAECPTTLLHAVPGPRGQTTAHHAWAIDPAGTWEYYLKGRQWGVPLGDLLPAHPALGAVLYEMRKGRRVQVLLNHVQGFRVVEL